jgi:hypothetical protein
MRRFTRRVRNTLRLLIDAWHGGVAGKRLLLALLVLLVLSMLSVTITAAGHGLVYTLF